MEIRIGHIAEMKIIRTSIRRKISTGLSNFQFPISVLNIIRCGLVLLVIAPVMGCRTVRQTPQNAALSASSQVCANTGNLEQHWGIRIEALRLSAHGRLLDFRYRVIDSAKAAALSDPANKPYLIDEASGTRLKVPNMPKVGPLRATAVTPKTGTIYTILFANAGARIKSGDLVTVEISKFRAEHLRVE